MGNNMRLHYKISILFAFLMLLICTTLTYTSYQHLTGMIFNTNNVMFEQILNDTAQAFKLDYNQVRIEMNLLLKTVLVKDDQSLLDDKVLLLKAALDNNENINTVFICYEDGYFISVRQHVTAEERRRNNLPSGNCYVLFYTEIMDGEYVYFYVYYDQCFNKIATIKKENAGFNPRSRVWYRQALKAEQDIMTQPYVFYGTKSIGITIARKTPDSRCVIGFDYTMDSLQNILSKHKISKDTKSLLVNESNEILVADLSSDVIYKKAAEGEIVTLDNILDPVIGNYAKGRNFDDNSNLEFVAEGKSWVGRKKDFSLDPNGQLFTVITATPEYTLMAKASEYKQSLIWTGIAIIVLTMPVVWISALLLARPLIYLSERLDNIRYFDFNTRIDTSSSILEIENLISSSQSMITTINNFRNIAETVTKEKDYDLLLSTILRESTAIVKSKGAAVYLLDHEDLTLNLESLYLHDKSSGIHDEILRKTLQKGPIPRDIFEDSLLDEDRREKIFKADYHVDNVVLLWPSLAFDSSPLLSTIILSDSEDRVMGYIVYAYDNKSGGRSTNAEFAFLKALSGFVSAAIEGQLLLERHKELLDGLIMLVADAIDAKSPYTGKHCQRVPVITNMIIEEACNSTEGIYRDYNLDADGWEEIRIASWLHDCGKVVTPVHIIDKATKLECIYNRIHEIRMRFELLKSYADTAYWRGISAGGDSQLLAEERDRLKQKLDEEFAFVADCNIGGEFMSDEAIARLNGIAERIWMRTLDDRLGLADFELQSHVSGNPSAGKIAVEEKLLSNKEWHIVKRENKEFEGDNPWGFTVEEPEYEYNRGELYNLSVRRGTLTDEDRYIINSHMIHTVKILSSLPFPKHMKNIVEIAASHHEKFEGGGYPRNIKAKELPLAARAMAIADIFEALTSSDRPYKKVKTLSEALYIMKEMKDDGHIDKDLFELFVRSGKPQEYANKYLLKVQQDEINIDDLLS